MARRIVVAALLVALACLTEGVGVAAADGLSLTSLPLPTMGGKQFWADELFFHQWRIQRNVLTGHCRLLDKNNLRHASGDFDKCRTKLDEIRRSRELPPMRGSGVIVLHGLFRSRSAMEELCTFLRQEGGYTVLNVGYPSTRRQISEHAQSLARIVENLDGIDEINFVAHSMGNIVVRHYLSDRAGRSASSASVVPGGRGPGPPVKRFVMLAPPNHGSLVALALAKNHLFKAVSGESGQQLGRQWAELGSRLATPECEFGIIAGGKGNDKGFNPFLPGDDDGTVSVASTRLAGARDFVIVPVRHSQVNSDQRVLQYTLRFFKRGHFVAAQKRRPVAK